MRRSSMLASFWVLGLAGACGTNVGEMPEPEAMAGASEIYAQAYAATADASGGERQDEWREEPGGCSAEAEAEWQEITSRMLEAGGSDPALACLAEMFAVRSECLLEADCQGEAARQCQIDFSIGRYLCGSR